MNKLIYNCKMIKRGISVLYSIEKQYLLYLILSSAMTPLVPYISIYMLALIVNELAGERRPERLIFFFGISLILNMIISLLISLVNHLKDYHHNQFFKNEQMCFSQKIMSMDYEDIENADIVNLHETIKAQSQTGFNMYYLYTFFGQSVSNIFNISIALVLVLPLFMNKTSSLFVKFFIVFSIIIVVIVNLYCNKKSNVINNAMYKEFVPHNMLFGFYSNYLSDYNTGKDIRLYSMEKMLEEEQKRQNSITNNILITAKKKALKFVLFGVMVKDILTTGVYLFVLFMCLRGNILLGDITKYAACIGLLVTSFSALIVGVQTLIENNKYLKNYFEFLDIPVRQLENKTPPCASSPIYEFYLENVWFRYPNSDNYALRDVSLTIKSGSKTAIVGENGSGKSTLIKLLCRLYEPEKGIIYLNGIDIREYDKKLYMEILSMVFQDFDLLAFSLGSNIAVTNEYNVEKSIEALEKVGGISFFEKLSHGFETPLYKDFDDEGIELSGGEAQKIALARAFYKNTRLLIFDEPTASLDPIAENEIYAKINQVIQNTTAIFVSHRLSSCKFCNTIIVFDRGELVQTGTHYELLSDTSGKYSELWNAQAVFYQR